MTFRGVFHKVQTHKYPHHDEFRRDFLEALKEELRKRCPELAEAVRLIVEYKVGRRKRADTRIGNLIIEFDRPPGKQEDVKGGKIEQLEKYMEALAEKALGATIHGVATNGWRMVFLEKRPGKPVVQSGPQLDFLDGADRLVALLCGQRKLPIIEPEDFVAIFGVW